MSKKLENNSKFFNVAKIRDIIILLLLITNSTVCKNPITIPSGAGKLNDKTENENSHNHEKL